MELLNFISNAMPLGVSFLLGLLGSILFVWGLVRPPKNKTTMRWVTAFAAIGMVGFMPLFASFLTTTA